MNNIQSIIRPVLEKINSTTNINEIKATFTHCIRSSKIRKKDKKSMLETILSLTDYTKTITFIYNCILKYEGEGIINETLSGRKIRRIGWKEVM